MTKCDSQFLLVVLAGAVLIAGCCSSAERSGRETTSSPNNVKFIGHSPRMDSAGKSDIAFVKFGSLPFIDRKAYYLNILSDGKLIDLRGHPVKLGNACDEIHSCVQLAPENIDAIVCLETFKADDDGTLFWITCKLINEQLMLYYPQDIGKIEYVYPRLKSFGNH